MIAIHDDAPWKLNIDVPDLPIEIEIKKISEDAFVFDLINADPSIANALRRIMLAEVESVAIENILLYMNKSVIHDEILCHRIGLIPIKLDPKVVKALPPDLQEVKFRLKVKNETRENKRVYSKDFEYIKNEKQIEILGEFPSVLHDDILINILAPGDELELEAICAISCGADHAKFSPVATAGYRAAPVIEVLDKDLKHLVKDCPSKVFDIEDGKVAVKNERGCTFCRECLRKEKYGGNEPVSLMRNERHFIFTVESVGVLPPVEIFRRAIKILRDKCVVAKESLNTLTEEENAMNRRINL
eukprot:augustus_masked-scaffold_18-processed-gene-3.15-mRNA-1 protein AED:0.35 eAED:0.35 QI:0/-1/0/1/-1/1/1/0/301